MEGRALSSGVALEASDVEVIGELMAIEPLALSPAMRPGVDSIVCFADGAI